MSPLLLLLALQLSAGSEPQTAPRYTVPETPVDDIEVIGRRVNPLLTVRVEGQESERFLIVSGEGVRCGFQRFQYSDYGRPRLCWTRPDPGTPLAFTPNAEGQYGRDWTVEWSGCESVDGAVCRVTGGNARTVTATFRRLRG